MSKRSIELSCGLWIYSKLFSTENFSDQFLCTNDTGYVMCKLLKRLYAVRFSKVMFTATYSAAGARDIMVIALVKSGEKKTN